ncbi:MAG: C_GCAxxG_C_C family protein [Bacteroidales bacterium]|nr:C_GCAxxG_C_C family protein [Bacteroidales bacterium]MBQ7818225.1 C_GCAxxG_C_C family protein [Bacteroidales bacterium]
MKDKIDVEARVELARKLFNSGYNCSQSVFMAYSDVYNIDKDFAARLVAPLGGGMGRLREVCGAVSGAFLVAGQEFSAENPEDRDAKTKNYAVVQELAEEFKKINGSIICRQLLGLAPDLKETHVPSERTAEYYKRRPCAEYVAIAARVVGEKINENRI